LFGGQNRPRGGDDHHAKILLDLEASLNGGARAFTLRVPELDENGRVRNIERVLNVQVPKGIVPGQQIRLAGQGARGQGQSKAGDLYIEVEFQPHALYQIDGRNLLLHMPVTPWEAALGAIVTTPTPGGPVELKIPAGSHAGSKLRLKGRGIPANPPGDFFVVLEIALPPADDEKSKAAYAAMASQFSFNPRASMGA
jgi:curved DNA-binding protein